MKKMTLHKAFNSLRKKSVCAFCLKDGCDNECQIARLELSRFLRIARKNLKELKETKARKSSPPAANETEK